DLLVRRLRGRVGDQVERDLAAATAARARVAAAAAQREQRRASCRHAGRQSFLAYAHRAVPPLWAQEFIRLFRCLTRIDYLTPVLQAARDPRGQPGWSGGGGSPVGGELQETVVLGVGADRHSDALPRERPYDDAAREARLGERGRALAERQPDKVGLG